MFTIVVPMLMLEVSEYLAEASRTLIQHGATIDKYMGDAIMAIWNAPVRQDGHVDLACRGGAPYRCRDQRTQ